MIRRCRVVALPFITKHFVRTLVVSWTAFVNIVQILALSRHLGDLCQRDSILKRQILFTIRTL